jgi:hypothetical protein
MAFSVHGFLQRPPNLFLSVKKTLLNPFRLLNSVPFGILLMALTAAFIAAGSARPWFREIGVDEWPILRNWFDKTDMQFFNAWPLKTLMALLVANLIVVTWRRIPLTPPRYGVWCIHAGIITLICGTSLYYRQKVEGRIRIFRDPSLGPAVVDHFYDKDQRSLYVRIGHEEPAEIPLPQLPRFKEYDDKHGNTGDLAGRGLTGISPALEVTDAASGDKRLENLAQFIGCKGQLKFDVVGFYPYAEVVPNFETDPASQMTGVDVTLMQTDDQHAMQQWTLGGTDPDHRALPPAVQIDAQHDSVRLGMEVVHLDANAAMVEAMSKAVGELFHLDVSLPDQPVVPLDVQIGKIYPVGKTGYSLKIQQFFPAFPLFETGEPVPVLMIEVTSPTTKFRRSVIQGRPTQTDFKIGAKMREQKPIDPALKIAFNIHDPFQLLPKQDPIKHTLLTAADSPEVVDLVAGVGSVKSEARHFAKGVGDIDLPTENPGDAPFAGPMQAAATEPAATEPAHADFVLHVERRDHLKIMDRLVVVPPAVRNRNIEDSGAMQVVKLKVSLGDWSTMVYAPFVDEAGDQSVVESWHGGLVTPPGAIAPLQVQLSNTRLALPARLSLDDFKLIAYDGASPDSPGAMIKDYISTITLSDITSGESYTDVARMNHPIYFDSGRWLFFQATYDSSPEHLWTGIGVGNRPWAALKVMLAGCFMIFFGLAYAFYVKPVIVRRMKEKAIAKAVSEGKTVRRELVSAD